MAASAPVCNISPGEPVVQPAPLLFPSVPIAQDLPSLIIATNTLAQVHQVITLQRGTNGQNGVGAQAGKSGKTGIAGPAGARGPTGPPGPHRFVAHPIALTVKVSVDAHFIEPVAMIMVKLVNVSAKHVETILDTQSFDASAGAGTSCTVSGTGTGTLRVDIIQDIFSVDNTFNMDGDATDTITGQTASGNVHHFQLPAPDFFFAIHPHASQGRTPNTVSIIFGPGAIIDFGLGTTVVYP